MTADQRLDQLEPLVAQNLAVADRHTAQLKQLVNLAIQQSDNMQFALRELAKLEQVDAKQQTMEKKLEVMDSKLQVMDEKMEVMDSKLQVMDEKMEVIDSKLDRIFDLLSGSGQ